MEEIERLLQSAAGAHWNRIGVKPHQGINTPLFSLRTKKSAGIGEFYDLIPLIDWLQPLGFDTIQMLPITASGDDPSPYNGLSANALNPIYLSLHKLPGMEEDASLKSEYEALKLLNDLPRVDYGEVKKMKSALLKSYVKTHGLELTKTAGYAEFLLKNPWLDSFALFKTLSELYKSPNWKTWPTRTDLNLHLEDLQRHKLLQYLCYQQMKAVKAHADQKKMYLLGDIPILVSQNSADVWSHPLLFKLNLTAGAPPDMYNKEGQSWGFPLYNYDAMAAEGFRFWKERLRFASELFHLYRIDHIVGFFRIFAIPLGKKAGEGHFEPVERSLWQAHGEKILTMMLESSSMLPIGEDLGVVPFEARETMRKLGIAGTKVIRWERDWSGAHHFIPFHQYPVDSLTTISTHDSEPLRLWWMRHPKEAKDFASFGKYPYQAELSSKTLFEILRDSYHTSSLFHVNLLQECLDLFPEFRFENPLDEQINLPGTVLPTNWTYRYKPSLEEMIAHPLLSKELEKMVK